MNLLTTVTAPTADLVTLAEARRHLRIWDAGDTIEDPYIQSLISAATNLMDGPDGIVGRALLEQTFDLTLDRFPEWCSGAYPPSIKLPLPPLIEVVSVEYTDSNGDDVALTDFRTFGIGAKWGGYIMPARNEDWPTTDCEPGAVRIRVKAGYSTDVPLPATFKHAALLLISHWHEHREAAVDTGAKFGLLELPLGFDRLINPLRVRA